MAGLDYRRCDVCGGKAFYDANLNYQEPDEGLLPYRIAGSEGNGLRLGYLGDWAVICATCAETHRTQIVKIRK